MTSLSAAESGIKFYGFVLILSQTAYSVYKFHKNQKFFKKFRANRISVGIGEIPSATNK